MSGPSRLGAGGPLLKASESVLRALKLEHARLHAAGSGSASGHAREGATDSPVMAREVDFDWDDEDVGLS